MNTKYCIRECEKANDMYMGNNISLNWKLTSINWCVKSHEDTEYYGSIMRDRLPTLGGQGRCQE